MEQWIDIPAIQGLTRFMVFVFVFYAEVAILGLIGLLSYLLLRKIIKK